MKRSSLEHVHFNLLSGRVKGVCSNKTTSNSLISQGHNELKGIDKEKDIIERRKIYSNLGPYLA